MVDDGPIPVVEVYGGVGIEDCQPPERIELFVKPQIDRVHSLDGLEQLAAFAADVGNAPEARMLAAFKCEAAFEIAAEERRLRPTVDLLKLRASVAGLGSRWWRDPSFYGSLIDHQSGPGADRRVEREQPLADLD